MLKRVSLNLFLHRLHSRVSLEMKFQCRNFLSHQKNLINFFFGNGFSVFKWNLSIEYFIKLYLLALKYTYQSIELFSMCYITNYKTVSAFFKKSLNQVPGKSQFTEWAVVSLLAFYLVRRSQFESSFCCQSDLWKERK